jgi:hypothetical protein
MSRSFIYLRRALFGTSCAIVFGFGASQALASPGSSRIGRCTPMGYDYPTPACGSGCPGNVGYCSEGGICRCGQVP